ncbi:unnamed protein product [Staurois parvus]|uniref:Uncharacterized protein n=1 Tax=Staurois parvus TaxID=386267 RepID=A0ABN9C9V8_9NEOB|nr:unnamed protein product [Staurois parvus]
MLLRKYDRGCSNFAKQTIVRHIKHRLWQRFHYRTTVLQIQHSWSDVKRRNPQFFKKVARRISATADGCQAVVCLAKKPHRRTATVLFCQPQAGHPLQRLRIVEEQESEEEGHPPAMLEEGDEEEEGTSSQAHLPARLPPVEEEEEAAAAAAPPPRLHGRLFCRRLPHLQLIVSVLDVLAYSLCALCNFDVCNVFCSILLFM